MRIIVFHTKLNKIKMTKYPFPVWGTQGGGLVRQVGNKFIFVEAPENFPDIAVGSEMHPMWDLIPANEAARNDGLEQDDFDRGMDEFFDAAFRLAEKGEIPLSTIGDFFPEEVKNRGL